MNEQTTENHGGSDNLNALVRFEQTDSFSQLYHCSNGGDCDGDYYRREFVEQTVGKLQDALRKAIDLAKQSRQGPFGLILIDKCEDVLKEI